MRRTDPKLQDDLMRGQEQTLMPTSSITVREHLELEIAAQVKYLELHITNSTKCLELQFSSHLKLFENLRAETELRYMQLFGTAIEAAKKQIEDLRLNFNSAIMAESRRHDDLRDADNDRITAAFTARREALEAALKDQAERTHVALMANEKRLEVLNELRKDVAMSVDVRAVDSKADRVEKGFDKLEARLEGRSGGLKDYIAWILAGVAIIGSVVALATRG